MRRGIVALVFRCHVVSGRPQTGTEATDIAWLGPDEISDPMDEAYAVRLLDALHPGEPAIRSHDGRMLVRSR